MYNLKIVRLPLSQTQVHSNSQTRNYLGDTHLSLDCLTAALAMSEGYGTWHFSSFESLSSAEREAWGPTEIFIKVLY